jgi:pimeloyl-ACP methyl ester carboxylesterase
MAACCLFHASAIDRFNLRKPSPPGPYLSKWLQSEFGAIRYVVTGQPTGPGAVLMPDPPNSIEQMAPLIEKLSRDYRVIAYDAPGFGYSRPGRAFNFSIAHNAQVIVELIQALNAGPAILAMTCVASLSGVYAAKRRPDLIKGLVLGQTPSIEDARRWAERVDVAGMLGRPYVGQALLKLMRNPISSKWYENAFPKGYDSTVHSRQTIESYQRGARFSLASALQALKADETRSSDLVIDTKAVVLWGMLDRTHRKTNRFGIMDCLPQGRFVELNQSGHFPDIELPEAFSDAVMTLATT